MHAARAIKSRERERLERLVRYMARPATSDERVTAVDNNMIRLRLKSPWRDGTESSLFTPSEFIEKLIALVPIPRFYSTRYYSVLALRSRHRRTLPDRQQQPEDAQISPAPPPPQGKGKQKKAGKKRLTWTALHKRTFKIDVLTCGRCGGELSLAVAGELRLTKRAFPHCRSSAPHCTCSFIQRVRQLGREPSRALDRLTTHRQLCHRELRL